MSVYSQEQHTACGITGDALQGHIVVEVCDMDNEPLVRMVGGSAVETVVSHDIIGRLMIQCARQPGLATVWEQLMGFDGGCSHEGLQGFSHQSHQCLQFLHLKNKTFSVALDL